MEYLNLDITWTQYTPVWENKTKGFKSAKSTVSRDILCRYGSTRNNLLTLYIVDVSRLH